MFLPLNRQATGHPTAYMLTATEDGASNDQAPPIPALTPVSGDDIVPNTNTTDAPEDTVMNSLTDSDVPDDDGLPTLEDGVSSDEYEQEHWLDRDCAVLQIQVVDQVSLTLIKEHACNVLLMHACCS